MRIARASSEFRCGQQRQPQQVANTTSSKCASQAANRLTKRGEHFSTSSPRACLDSNSIGDRRAHSEHTRPHSMGSLTLASSSSSQAHHNHRPRLLRTLWGQKERGLVILFPLISFFNHNYNLYIKERQLERERSARVAARFKSDSKVARSSLLEATTEKAQLDTAAAATSAASGAADDDDDGDL